MPDIATATDLLTSFQEPLVMLCDLLRRDRRAGRPVGQGTTAWCEAMVFALSLARRDVVGATDRLVMDLTPARPRGRQLHLVLPGPVGVGHHLAGLEGWTVRVGPAPVTLLLIDGTSAIVSGPARRDGAPTLWWTTDSSVCLAARRSVDLSVGLSAPCASPSSDGQTSERRRQVAHGLVEGWTNARLSRALDVSERTASAMVQTLCQQIGARDRLHAIRILAPLVAPARERAAPGP